MVFHAVLMFVNFTCRRTVVSIPNGPSDLAITEAALGLARYAAICQVRFFIEFVNLLGCSVCSISIWDA